jgi:hypothetical protein
MSHQFKPGDLAIIIGCHSDPSDIGKVVELQQMVSDGQEFDAAGWTGLVFSDVSPGWVCLSENVTDTTGLAGFCVVDPRHLMPLRGDFAPEQSKTREVSA